MMNRTKPTTCNDAEETAMRIDSDRSVDQVLDRLKADARHEYGEERAAELEVQLEHTARMMIGVGRQRLDVRDESLTSGPYLEQRGETS
jgi:hypothetical protein